MQERSPVGSLPEPPHRRHQNYVASSPQLKYQNKVISFTPQRAVLIEKIVNQVIEDFCALSGVASHGTRRLLHAQTDTLLKTALAGSALSSNLPASASERGAQRLAWSRIGR